MNESKEPETIAQFRKRLKGGDVNERMSVLLKISGGLPGQRKEFEFKFDGGGAVRTSKKDELRSIDLKEITGSLKEDEARILLDKVLAVQDKLIPRSKARFVPDSLVGSITYEIDGREVQYFFHPEEDERLVTFSKGIELNDVIDLFERKSEELHSLKEKKVKKGARPKL